MPQGDGALAGDLIQTTIKGRDVRLTRESAAAAVNEPNRLVTVYWVAEIDGTRYVGWPATPDDTEASVGAQLTGWAAAHPLVFR
jgi:hypothetical protein